MSIYHRQILKGGSTLYETFMNVLDTLLSAHPAYEKVADYVPELQPGDGTDPFQRMGSVRYEQVQVWKNTWGDVSYYFSLMRITGSGGGVNISVFEEYADGQMFRPVVVNDVSDKTTPAADGSIGSKGYDLVGLFDVKRDDPSKPRIIAGYSWWGGPYYKYDTTTYQRVGLSEDIQTVGLPFAENYTHNTTFYISERGVYLAFTYGLPYQFMGWGTYDTWLPAEADPCPVFMFSTARRISRTTRMPYGPRMQKMNYEITDPVTTQYSVVSGAILGSGDRIHGQRSIMTRMMVRQLGKADTHGAMRGLYANIVYAESHGGTIEVQPRLTQTEVRTKDSTWKILGQRGKEAYLVNVSVP